MYESVSVWTSWCFLCVSEVCHIAIGGICKSDDGTKNNWRRMNTSLDDCMGDCMLEHGIKNVDLDVFCVCVSSHMAIYIA